MLDVARARAALRLRAAAAPAVALSATTAARGRPGRLALVVAGAGRGAAVGEGQRLAGQFFDLAQERPLAVVAERNRAAGEARAGRAPDAVDISLRHVRQLVVHHVAHGVDVDPARGDVGGDENARRAALEVVERANALVLALVAVDRLGPHAGGVEVLRDAIGAALGAGEDDGAGNVGPAHQFNEHIALGGAVDEKYVLIDALDRGRGRRDADFDRVLEHVAGEAGDLLRHGGGEQQRLARLRQFGDDPADRHDEAEVEHVVGLVEHQHLGRGEVQLAASHMVDEPAGGRDQDVEAARDEVELRTRRHAADHDGEAEGGLHELGVGAKAVADLGREFSGRSEDQHAGGERRRAAAVGAEARENRQRERRRLAGAGLGDAKQIAPFEEVRNSLSLDGGRRLVAFAVEGAKERLGETEIGKLSHGTSFNKDQARAPRERGAVGRSEKGETCPA